MNTTLLKFQYSSSALPLLKINAIQHWISNYLFSESKWIVFAMFGLLSSCKLVGSIRKSAIAPAMVQKFCLGVFTCSSHGYMQWVKVVWPRMSLLSIRCPWVVVIHIFISSQKEKTCLDENQTVETDSILD